MITIWHFEIFSKTDTVYLKNKHRVINWFLFVGEAKEWMLLNEIQTSFGVVNLPISPNQ